jgi:hypothetical protein
MAGFYALGSWQNLTPDVMTNLFLYGQLTTPPEIFDRITHDVGTASDTTVQLDMFSFMSTGPGRYALPSLAPFVQAFFTGSAPALQGSFTAAQLIALGKATASDFTFSIQQYQIDPSSSDYPLRTYIYNTESRIVLTALGEKFAFREKDADHVELYWPQYPCKPRPNRCAADATHITSRLVARSRDQGLSD